MVYEPFWRSRLLLIREILGADGVISPEDLDLLEVIDKPHEIVETIFKHYETRGFELSPPEQ